MSNNLQVVATQAPVVNVTTSQPGFTPGAQDYFVASVTSYADRLAAESRSIERMEHTGDGPAEITAAHVEEAKWVLVRRMRRKVASSRWVVVLRLGQAATAALVGIGTSNLTQSWGAILSIVAILLGSIALIAEREMSRE